MTSDLDELDAIHLAVVGLDIGDKSFAEGSDRLVLPAVIELEREAGVIGQTHIPEVEGELRGVLAVGEVDHADRVVAVFERTDKALAAFVAPVVDLVNAAALGVLVDCDNVAVGEDLLCFGGHISDVAADHQRGVHYRPEGEVCAVFLGGAAEALARDPVVFGVAAHSDDEHINVVPAVNSGLALAADLREGEVLDRVPVVLNIAGRAEHLRAGVSDPVVDSVAAPVAGREEDVSAAVAERHRHSAV